MVFDVVELHRKIKIPALGRIFRCKPISNSSIGKSYYCILRHIPGSV